MKTKSPWASSIHFFPDTENQKAMRCDHSATDGGNSGPERTVGTKSCQPRSQRVTRGHRCSSLSWRGAQGTLLLDRDGRRSPVEARRMQAANALKGPRLVSGELGGAVTIRCHYTPLSINRHQRKYWCRLGPPTGTCHTVVSTNHYTHPGYRGRAALADFPQSSVFVVRLSQLSTRDEGHYRCGIGNSNNALFFSVSLTVSAGSSRAIPTAPPAAGEFLTEPFGAASLAANRWTSGATRTLDGQGTKWDRAVPTTETRKTTASAQRRQTPGTVRAVARGADSGAESSIQATVPVPQSPVSKLGGLSSTTEDVWGWGTWRLVTEGAGLREGGKATGTGKPGEQTERTEIAGDAARKTTGTISPSAQAWETLPEAAVVPKQQALVSTDGASGAASPWTLDTTRREPASVEGSPGGDPSSAAGDQGFQATPSQGPAAGPRRRPEESSRKSAFPEGESGSWTLTPVFVMLAPFLLVALVLWQRRLWRRRSSREAERTPRVTLIQMTRVLELNLQPDQLPNVKKLQGDPLPPPPPQASLPVLERDPGP
ncbi:high affinity immunoglobulin alpha and immunoglobulin mu Fc receptor [Fukomys damarensis]|uniref:high affinity immunoglobulin alpha and immunoglobulin mu Fc receptor n=1 Tax=Fukomys damarensis TaxID=885580 RepID=UPI0014557BB9|nr:high affinity immunoglobulin alpha and immunoglobulin mu Fc receptor [Fukomys damarensis]